MIDDASRLLAERARTLPARAALAAVVESLEVDDVDKLAAALVRYADSLRVRITILGHRR